MRTEWVETKLGEWMGKLVAMLGPDPKFICGDNISMADCCLLPSLAKFQAGFIDHVPPTCLDKFPIITAYLDRVRAQPAIKAYYDSKK